MNSSNFPIVQTFLGNCTELATQLEQVMYHQLKRVKPIETVNEQGKRVIHTPTVGVEIIYALIARMIDEQASVWSEKVVPSVEEVLMPYVKEEWHYVYDEELKQNVLNFGVFERIYSIIMDIRTDVRNFLGKDPWIIHFFEEYQTDFVIKKSIDFRIYDWNRRTNNGTWTRELAAELTANEQSLLDERKHRTNEAIATQAHNDTFGKI